MTPFDDFAYLVNHVLLGEEPTIEDFILLVGTLVAFIAFILWCCFPIQPKETSNHRQLMCKSSQNTQDATTQMHTSYGNYSHRNNCLAIPNDYRFRHNGGATQSYHSCS